MSLNYEPSSEQVKDMFKACGQVENLELPMNNEGRPSGFGFLTFKVNP